MFLSLTLFIAVLVIVICWLGMLTYFGYRTYSAYLNLSSNLEEKDIIHILKNLKTEQKDLKIQADNVAKNLDILAQTVRPHIQKIGFVRYNPFGNTGGDQSFCLCLLDGRGDGILLTSLHAREQTRIYTKEIRNNKPDEDAQLSKEEEKCLKIAQKWSSR